MFWLPAAYAADEVCTAWAEAEALKVTDSPSVESSGLAPHPSEDGLFYTHDDEGGVENLYFVDLVGRHQGEQRLLGATNQDWEDVATGPCPAAVDGDACVYVGDIGDNDEVRERIVVYVAVATKAATVDAVACPLVYPEGARHDAEALLLHPDGTLRLVTKEGDGEARVFRAPALACDGEAQTLVKEAEVALGAPVTGGAVSDDGAQVALRSDDRAWIWSGCTLDWGAEPTEVALPGAEDGEAVAFSSDGGLLVSSEGDPLQLGVLACAATEPAPCACGCGSAGYVGGLSAAAAGLAAALGRRRRRVDQSGAPRRSSAAAASEADAGPETPTASA